MEFVDWFNLAVYTQPFLFGLLYPWKQRIEPIYMYLASAAALYGIWRVGDIGHYPVHILAGYIFMVLFTFYYYNYHGFTGFKPVSLAFLIVFLNSFWWEFPIHVVGTLTNLSLDNVYLFLIQSCHLVPLLFLREFPEIQIRNRREVLGYALTVWSVVSVVILVKLYMKPSFGWLLDHGLRFFALLQLLKVFRPVSLKYIKGEDEALRVGDKR